ncbi:hypothetical protein ASD18_04100 [Cellulomonas sp. Root137]|nr:DUF222 domain-containing protein [Cellulomonas sp. Root137]KQY46616.1 hypothetical protein ASD18_04100 [Cellulomonas sp. Root137]
MFEATHPRATRAAEPLAHLRASASVLVERVATCADWSGSERSAALSSLDLVAAQLSCARARLLVAERDAGTSQRPGDRSFEAARARLTRTGAAEATREVRQADALVSMPAVADAVGEGRVPLGHLDVLARVAATASPEVAQALRSAELQATVVSMAERQSVPDFARSIAQLAAARDPQALEDSHQAARRERSLVLSHQARGTYLKGFLDRVAGEALQAALDSAGQAPDETRSPAQANADALVAVARRACAGLAPRQHDAPGPDGTSAEAVEREQGASSRPHLSLIVPADTFAALREHHRERAASGADVRPASFDVLDDDDLSATERGRRPATTVRDEVSRPWSPVVPATLEDGTPVAMSELAQALCDCEITRIVVSAEGVPLDLGADQADVRGGAPAGGGRAGPAVRLERVPHVGPVVAGAPHPLVGPGRRLDVDRERCAPVRLPPPRGAPARSDDRAPLQAARPHPSEAVREAPR